ncbi:MAG: gliding motility-associated C-terminal domain-containing protein [Hyphomicrobiales bacterium]
MRTAIFSFFCLLLSFNTYAQRVDSSITCLKVNEAGDVEVNWSKASTTSFLKYQLYVIQDDEKPELIKEFKDVDDISFEHKGVGANHSSVKYFVRTVRGVDFTDSPIIETIFLRLDSPDYAQANLSWNSPSATSIPGLSDEYILYKKGNNSKPWKEIATTNNTSYYEENHVCGKYISYQIKLQGLLGCEYLSNVVSLEFRDVIPPGKPVLDSVSVVNGKIVLGWQPAKDKDVVQYTVFKRVGSGNLPIGTTEGYSSTFYEDAGVDPCSEVVYYSVNCIDSCGNVGPSTHFDLQGNILIQDNKYDPCNNSLKLKWTAYENPKTPIERYDIIAGKLGQPMTKIGSVDGNTVEGVFAGFDSDAEYEVLVRAIGSNKSFTSSSCKVEVKTRDYKEPKFIQLTGVSVNDKQRSQIYIDADNDASIQGYIVSKSLDAKDGYNEVEFVKYSGKFPVVYEDTDTDVLGQSIYYKVQLVDSCGDKGLTSEILNTLYLKPFPETSQKTESGKKLDWDAYTMWPEGVKEYRIYRGIGKGVVPNELIATVGGFVTNFSDNISDIANTDGFYSYRVEAIPKNLNRYIKIKSNIIFLQLGPDVYMPNAFKVNGINSKFKPIGRNISTDGFVMRIYSRWGQLIFEGNDPFEGWDGKINNHPAMIGVYVYQIFYNDLEGKQFQLKGIVTLVR